MAEMIQRYKIPILLILFYLILMTPLMGRKKGYTVDANPSFYITYAIVETGNLFPPVSVKQGYFYSIVYTPFYLLGKSIHLISPDTFPAGWIERKLMCW